MSIDPGLLMKLGVAVAGVAPRPAVSLAELKRIISVDLEHLLNTRSHTPLHDHVGRSQTGRSLVHFGVADFSAKYFENALDVHSICDAVACCIRAFEPRLQGPHVSAEAASRAVGGLGLLISAVLVANGVREPIRFNAMFDVVTKKYAISTQR
jgi:type VI secretion system protein ImpF